MTDFLSQYMDPSLAEWVVLALVAVGVLLAVIVLVRAIGGVRERRHRAQNARLAVIDAEEVDGRRRLVLVRRDGVEHLLMIGGPTDIVIESGIGAPRSAPAPQPVLQQAMPPVPVPEARPAVATPPRPAPAGLPPRSKPAPANAEPSPRPSEVKTAEVPPSQPDPPKPAAATPPSGSSGKDEKPRPPTDITAAVPVFEAKAGATPSSAPEPKVEPALPVAPVVAAPVRHAAAEPKRESAMTTMRVEPQVNVPAPAEGQPTTQTARPSPVLDEEIQDLLKQMGRKPAND